MKNNRSFAKNPNRFSKVPLHPLTYKAFAKGHAWVLADEFTQKFPKDARFLIGLDKANKDKALLLNDPEHPNIKALLWSLCPPFENNVGQFYSDLENRLNTAINKRINLKLKDQRENYYLVFGEADLIPGLHIQKLSQHILVSYYSFFWINMQRKLKTILLSSLAAFFPNEKLTLHFQMRLKSPPTNAKTNIFKFNVNEYGINYQIMLGQYYDFGIYTDMSSIRKELTPYFSKAESLLNLYSYTGAYSLYPMSLGVDEVHSVDLSEKYMEWLNDNLRANPNINQHSKHISHVKSCFKAVNEFLKENKQFDIIISDPPSFSSDGNNSTSALKAHEEILPKLSRCLKDEGHLIIFLNTHKIKKEKFKQRILKTIQNKKLPLQIIKELKTSEDCPTKKGFEEGSYLKGLVLKKEK